VALPTTEDGWKAELNALLEDWGFSFVGAWDGRAFGKFLSSRLYWKSRRLGKRAPKAQASRGVWWHAPPENFET